MEKSKRCLFFCILLILYVTVLFPLSAWADECPVSPDGMHKWGPPEELAAPEENNCGLEKLVCIYCDDYIIREQHIWGDWIIDRQPTEQAEGLKHRICTRCSAVDEEPIAKQEHNVSEREKYADATCESPAIYWCYCPNCGEGYYAEVGESLGGHVWDMENGVITKAVTCTEDGMISFPCINPNNPDCKETLDEIIVAPGHTEVTLEGKDATCLEPGYTAGTYCSVCGEILDGLEEIPQLEHTVVSFPGREATCTEPGLTAGTYCSECMSILEGLEEIPATGHTPVELEEVAATCAGPGHTAGSYCSVCMEILDGLEEIPQLEHTPVTLEEEVPPTCTEPGYEPGTYCSVCYQILDGMEEIPATGHTPVTLEEGIPPTCTESGYTAGTYCSVCNQILDGMEEIPATGHTPVTVPGKAPTASEPGLTDGTVCSVCGEVLEEQEEIPPLGAGTPEQPDTPVNPSGTGRKEMTLPVLFGLLRGIVPEAADIVPVIASQPETGKAVLKVAVQGGTEPYAYEWHCNTGSGVSGEGTVNTAVETYNRAKAAFAALFDDAMTALDPAAEETWSGSSYSRNTTLRQETLAPVSLDLNDVTLEGGNSDTFEALYSGCYYCVVRDTGGHRIVSEEVAVTGESGMPAGVSPEINAYSPAELRTDIVPEDFSGYWVCRYVQIMDVIFSAADLDDRTDAYIEAPRAALGGPLFGDVLVEMELTDNALTFTAEETSIVLALQEDGLLRMTLSAPDADLVLYLESSSLAALDETAD